MASEVEICKLALSNIRARSINSLTESSVEAQQCKLKYSIVRDFLLRDVPWQFAREVKALALRTDEPLEWVYAYQYPSDCLNVRYITADFGFKDQTADGIAYRDRYDVWFVEPERQVPFELGSFSDGKAILTDQEDAYAVYTKRVTDPNQYDSQFILAFSWYLASELAVPLVGGDQGRTYRNDALQMYRAIVNAAVAADGNEKHRVKRKPSDMIEARTV